MYLAQLFRANPLLALALLICLATILWCILLTRRQRNGFDKVLTGLLGLIAIYESLRILKDSGFAIFSHFHMLEGWVDFISACLYLLAAMILKTSSIDRAASKVHLRLMEAGEKPTDLGKPPSLRCRSWVILWWIRRRLRCLQLIHRASSPIAIRPRKR